MTVFAWRRFGGQVPRAHARLLPDVNAQKAVNTKLWSGKIRAFKRSKFDFQTVNPGPIRSIYKYRGGGKEGWLHWSTDVDVVKAPLAGDDYGRIYLTGAGRPKFADSTSVIAFQANLAAGAAAGVSQLTVSTNRGFAIGDECIIRYAPTITQLVTLTGVAPSGGNLLLTFTPPTTGLLTTANTVTNNSNRFPLVTYDLGVPAPAQKLTLQVVSGGIEGSEGVSQGDILGVSDIIVSDFTATDTSTVGEVQSGSASWTLHAHAPFHDVAGVVTDGQAMLLEASCRFSVRLNNFNEVRDVEFQIIRSPTGSAVQVAADVSHIARPSMIDQVVSGAGNDWTYEVKADAVDVPVGGTYTYRMTFGPVPGLAGNNNNSFTVTAVWAFKARYSNRIKLTLAAGHGLVVGDSIRLTISKTPETLADRELNGKVVDVLAVNGNDITINALHGGTYAPGGRWQKSYTTDETSDRAYVYTYVASFNGQDFESPPSPVSSLVTVALNGAVRLTGFINPTTPTLLWDTNFSSLRIYRLNPGETTQAEYLFLAEVPITTTQHDDSVLGENLGEVLQSTDWELPPEDLQGLIELPEGGAAAFTKKEFLMAEPYFLHAWPARNRRTTHDEIVAIGAFGNSIGIATKGTPYVVTGLDPATVSMERIEIVEPCLANRGAVDLGYAFGYPSADGLVLLSIARAEVVTGNVFTPDEWMSLNPASFIATNYSGRYLCFYDSTTLDPVVAAKLKDVEFERPSKGAFIFDPKDPVSTLVFLDITATEAWTDPQTKRVYIVQAGAIREFDADRLEMEFRWKTKEAVLASPVSMGFACVEASAYPLKFTVFADRHAFYTRTVVDREPFRLPPGEFESWAAEVEGVHQVEGIYLAETIEDLAKYMGGQ